MIKKVLFVDDDRILRHLIQKKLDNHKTNFIVLTAKDGLDAVKELKENSISLVVTDLQMPQMDGFALLAHLSEKYPDIPVIIQTGYSTSKSKKHALERGAAGYIEKPFKIEQLAEKIISTLKKESEGGILQTIPLEMFIQLVEMEQKTCTIRVVEKTSGELGVLFFRNGDLVEARIGAQQGMPAAYKIFAWDQVTLSIQDACAIKDKRIVGDLQAILFDAMRLKDEAGESEEAFSEDLDEDLDKDLNGDIDKNLDVDLDLDLDVDIDKNLDVDLDLDLEGALDKNLGVDLDLDLDGALDKKLDVDLDLDLEGALDKNLGVDLDLDLDGALDKNLGVDLDLDPGVDLDKNLDVDLDLDPDVALDKNLDVGLDLDPGVALDKNLDVDLDLDPEGDLDKNLDVDLDLDSDVILDKSLDVDFDLDPDVVLDKSLDVDFDLDPDVVLDKNLDVELNFEDAKTDFHEPPPQTPSIEDTIQNRLESASGERKCVKDVYQDNSWDDLILQVSEIGKCLEAGALKSCYINKGEPNDFILVPGKQITVVSVDPKCPRDRMLQALR